jgi:hypothetical protein
MERDRRVETKTRWVLAAGALISAAMTAYVGWHSSARVLIAPFVLWVVSPFVVLWWTVARARAPGAASLLAWTAEIVAAGSAAAYGARIVWPPRAQAAFVFVIVPPIAWLLIVAAVIMGRRSTRPRQ